MGESRRQRFERLSESRKAKAVEQIRLFGNLSNIYAYDSTEEDVLRFAQAIQGELVEACGRFDVDIASFGISRLPGGDAEGGGAK